MTVRHSFVEHFGEEQATKVEESSLTHMRDTGEAHKEDKWGDDPFQYHLLTCIAYDCFTKPKNRDFHGITAPLDDLRAWVLEYGNLYEFHGDIPDYLALVAGQYNSWINWDKAGAEPPAGMAETEAELDRWRTMSTDEALSEMSRMAQDLLNEHGFWTPEEED